MTEPPRIDGSRDKVVRMVNTGWMTEKSRFDARHRKEMFLHSKATRLATGVSQPPIQWKPRALCPTVRMPEAIPHDPYAVMVCTRTTVLYLESTLGTVGHFEAGHLIFLPRILDPSWETSTAVATSRSEPATAECKAGGDNNYVLKLGGLEAFEWIISKLIFKLYGLTMWTGLI